MRRRRLRPRASGKTRRGKRPRAMAAAAGTFAMNGRMTTGPAQPAQPARPSLSATARPSPRTAPRTAPLACAAAATRPPLASRLTPADRTGAALHAWSAVALRGRTSAARTSPPACVPAATRPPLASRLATTSPTGAALNAWGASALRGGRRPHRERAALPALPRRPAAPGRLTRVRMRPLRLAGRAARRLRAAPPAAWIRAPSASA